MPWAPGRTTLMRVLGYDVNRDISLNPKSFEGRGFTLQGLRQCGCSARNAFNVGYTCADLHAAGVGAHEMRSDGFAVPQLKSACYAIQELRDRKSVV